MPKSSHGFWIAGLNLFTILKPLKVYPLFPLNIQPVVVMRGLKRQQAAALTNFVGCFLGLISFFSPSVGAE